MLSLFLLVWMAFLFIKHLLGFLRHMRTVWWFWMLFTNLVLYLFYGIRVHTVRKRLTFQMLVYLFFSAFVDLFCESGRWEEACCLLCVCVSGRVLHGATCVSPREAQRVAVLVSGCFNSSWTPPGVSTLLHDLWDGCLCLSLIDRGKSFGLFFLFFLFCHFRLSHFYF